MWSFLRRALALESPNRAEESFASGPSAREYSAIRDFVEASLVSRQDASPPFTPSQAWLFSAENFRYVRHLPDFELTRIRYHTYHLTSDWYLTYAVPRPDMADGIRNAYASLSQDLDFFPDEGAHGIGFDLGGRRVSWDLIRYMQVIADLRSAGAITAGEPVTVLEIGGGYGGLASLLYELNPNLTYVSVDLEETLFFQAVHLVNRFGDGCVNLCRSIPRRLERGIFLIPQARSEGLQTLTFDLAINQQSMQEMTLHQVERYCRVISSSCKTFYSCNRHEHTGALARGWNTVRDLTELLDEFFPEILWRSSEDPMGYGDAALPRRVYATRREDRRPPGGDRGQRSKVRQV